MIFHRKFLSISILLAILAIATGFSSYIVLANESQETFFDGSIEIETIGDNSKSTGNLSITGSNTSSGTDSSTVEVDVSYPPRFEPVAVSVAPDPVAVGRSVEIDVEIRNRGSAGRVRVVLSVDSTRLESWVPHLEPGESVTLSATAAFETTGTHPVAVNGLSMATVTVIDPTDRDGENGAVSVESTPANATTAEAASRPDSTPAGEDSSTAYYPGVLGLFLAFALFGLVIASRRRAESND